MATKKATRKKRLPTVMVSVRFPPDLEQRAKVAARHQGVTLQAFVQAGVKLALGDA
jgi:hypothetical protein